MIKSRLVILNLSIILFIWIIFYLFKENLFIKYKNNLPTPKSINTQIVYKYNKLEKLLKFNYPKLHIEILETFFPNISQKKHKIIKKKYNSKITLNLQYIIITPTKKIAFINNRLVKIGDYINKFKIVDIKKDCVIIKYERKLKCIYLK